MRELEVLEGAGVVIGDDGLIAAVGPLDHLVRTHAEAIQVEVQGVLFPGFVDAHTHAVFGAARLVDHERRARGDDYKAIAAAGGGILSSVHDLRGRGADDLAERTRRRLAHLLALGTTTVEVKSGYGLSLKDELKTLAVLGQLRGGAPDVIPTFLGAHEVPPEFRPDRARYVRHVIEEMIPAVAAQGIARFCDVFCEPGVFTREDSRAILEAGRAAGLEPKIHADELDGSGGAELAAALGAISADHLARISAAGVAALAASATVAVLLPGTMLFLGKRDQAPARALVDGGAAVALATDFNPGSSPALSLPLMAMLGVSQLRLLPAEAVIAITANAAAAVGEARTRGQIAPGFRADLVLAAADDWRELPYWYGTSLVREVWVLGTTCHPWGASVNSIA